MWVLCIVLSVAAALVHLPIRERGAGARAEHGMSRRLRYLLVGSCSPA